MNKKVLATALLCFSLLLLLPSAALATSSQPIEKCAIVGDRVTNLPNSSLSMDELLALSGYATPTEEPVNSINSVKTRQVSSDSKSPPIGIDYIPRGDPWPAPVHTMIVIDDDAELWIERVTAQALRRPVDFSWSDLCSWANNILETGDDPFESLHHINFVTTQYRYWYSPSGRVRDLLWWAQTAFPRPADVEVTFILTGQAEGNWAGFAESDAFIITTNSVNLLCPMANAWQHEASHLYSCLDHDPGLTTICIMSYSWMMFTRNWCTDCNYQIAIHRFRFGIIYV